MAGTRVFKFGNLDDRMMKLDKQAVILNTLQLETEEDRRRIEALTLTRYETTDVLATAPTCGCGKYTKAENLGVLCEDCDTRVVSHHNQAIESDVWISVPEGIDWFLAPLPFIFLNDKLKVGRSTFSCLQWALDPTISHPDPSNKKASELVRQLESLGYKRGLRHLREEFDKLLTVAARAAGARNKREELIAFMEYYREDIFVKHVPIPSKVAFAVESTAYGNYYDKTMTSAMEAIFAAVGTSTEKDVRRLESRFTNILMNLAAYYRDVVEKNLSGKPGWLRRVNFGSRMNFSFRNIVTSEHGLHGYDEIKIPYHQLLTILEPLVIARMIERHNYSYSEAYAYCQRHATDEDMFLWTMLEEFIDETPPAPKSVSDVIVTLDDNGKPTLVERESTLLTRKRTGGGIKCAGTRYPSLARTSTQGLRIVGISKCEIRVSVLALIGCNMDKGIV